MRTPTEFDHEIAVASHFARQAGDAILTIYATEFSVDYKAKNDPVTEADRLASRVIVEGLRREFPDDLVVSEEEPVATLDSAPDRVWYVDPLDGTQEFIKRNGEFAVMIGLAISGRPVVGVVLRPVTAELFWGIVGEGAWLGTKGTKQQVGVSSETNLSRLRLVASRSHRDRLVDDVRRRLGISEESRIGSVGVKVGLLVTRQADVYVEPSAMTKAWDSCAPEAILHAGGGWMTDREGAPLRYVPSEVRNWKGIVATNGVCHERVISEIASVLRERSQ